MLTEAAQGSPAVAIQALNALKQLRSPIGKSVLDNVLGREAGAGYTSISFQATNSLTNAYYGQNLSYGVLLVDGIQTVTQGVNILNGWSGGIVLQSPPVTNPFVDGAKDFLLQEIQNAYPLQPNRILVVGHSIGGCIAMEVGRRIYQANPNRTVNMLTFGSPRLAGELRIREYRNQAIWRWFNSDDPVPLLPPRLFDNLLLAPLYSISAWSRFSQFLHPPGGLQINSSGGMVPNELPADAEMSQTSAIAGWLASLDGPAANSHSIDTYLNNFSLAAQSQGTRVRSVEPTAPAEIGLRFTHGEVTRAERQAMTVIAQATAAQNSVEVAIPSQQAFSAARSGRVWACFFGSEAIAICGSKRGARGLARDMNAAFRRLQRQPLVEPSVFATQLQGYLAAAADPTSGFRPTLSTTLPV